MPLRDIQFQHVVEFCETWREGVRVEYKKLLTDQIPKVVASFANTFGGIWVIGVELDLTTNQPQFPIKGFAKERGIEERITEACWKGIYPPLTPMVQVIDVPSASENIVVVVKVPESIEAPHAVEGSTKVYVRVNSTSQPIDLAEIDRIDYLLKRRHDPKQRRQQMIETAIKRSRVAAPCIRIMIGPRYPYRPL